MGAVVCIYVVTLTVSRGALLAVAIAIVIASRTFLKHGFFPLLLSICGAWLVIELGIFEQSAKLYATRGAEETGRLDIWPLIVESFYESPWIGVGHLRSGAITPDGRFYTPHNGFLYIAQTSGIIPLMLFIAYWVRVTWVAFKGSTGLDTNKIFYLPFLAYCFITVNVGNYTFMQLPVIASLAFPMVASVKRRPMDITASTSSPPIVRGGM
jgi:O-antigen ligase